MTVLSPDKLYGYQHKAVDAALEKDGKFCLFMDMRTG